jgi:flagellar biosynthesis protein FlhF
MEILVEQGASREACVSKIAAKYGGWFHILREKKIRVGGFLGFFSREGVELEFYIPPVLPRPPSGQNYQQGPPLSFQVPASAAFRPPLYANEQPPLSFEEAKKKVLAAAGKDPGQIARQIEADKDASPERILDELREIKEKIGSGAGRQEDHPSLIRLAELLRLNDFSESYIEGMLERARKELSLDSLDNFDGTREKLLEWIGESISVYREGARKRGRIMALVGPTGVGKTTTIAKLAAIFGIDNSGGPSLPVRLVTIDAFRIGARAQIEKFGKIMGFPVSYIDNRRDLKKEIALYQEETGVILIDTFGSSPRDPVKLGEMKEILDACGSRAEVHLVLSAGTKTGDMVEILRQFEPFNYRSVLLTKLDETAHIGNVISVLAEGRKPVSYITDGQTVPHDIKKASVVRFLVNLDEFKVDREKIEKRFPVDEADQIQWS